MADPDAEITVQARGRSYSVYYGNRAFRIIERQLQKPIAKLDESSLDELTTMIWGGMLIRQPEITIEEVDEIIDEIGYTRVGEIVQEALARALPEAAGTVPPNPNRATRRAQANGTGKAS